MKLFIQTHDDTEPRIRDVEVDDLPIVGLFLTACPCCHRALVVHHPATADHALAIAVFTQAPTARRWVTDVIAPLDLDWTRPIGDVTTALSVPAAVFLRTSAMSYDHLAETVQQFHLQFHAGAITPGGPS